MGQELVKADVSGDVSQGRMAIRVSSHGNGYTCTPTNQDWKDISRPSMYIHLHRETKDWANWRNTRFKLWGPEIADDPPEVEYKAVMESDSGVAEWTRKIVSTCFYPSRT